MSRHRTTRAIITGAAVPGRTGVSLLARLRMASGQLVTQASISSITYTVSNVSLGTALGAGTFTVSSSIYDALQQNDVRWAIDSAAEPGPDLTHGFNFLGTLGATLFSLATLAAPGVLTGEADAETMQCDVFFTPVSGQPFRVIYRWPALPVYG